MYTFFIFILFIPILHTAPKIKYGFQKFAKLGKLDGLSKLNDIGRLGRSSGEPKIFATCFDHLGCVDTNEKWYDSHYRPVNLEPLDRHTIRTEFLLMKASTNGSKEIHYEILTLKPQSIDISGFKKGKKTFFLIHDFTSNGHTGWIKHVALAVTEEMDANLISVDWEAGAEPPFDQAISNARVVALEMEVFLKMLTEKFSIKLDEVHVIGHGVGAHIAGYVGKSVRGIGRITGLDPTGPRFENMPSLVRLDTDDAKYVEVLHTEAYNHRSQGTLEPIGHSDFYLNNAAHQPGCSENSSLPKITDVTRTEIREGKILPACSHKRSFKYYISAITTRECKFVGIACNSYESFLNGSCSDCDNNMCATFDMCPPPKNVYKTRFFLNTHAEPPFCMHAYQVNISIESNEYSKKVDGYFEFILIDVNNKITFAVDSDIGNIKRSFIPGVTYTLIIYAPPPAISEMKEAKVKWRSSTIFPFPKKPVYVKYISVRRIPMLGENLPTNGMCPESGLTEIKDSAYIQFVSCDVAKIEEEQRIAALTTTVTPSKPTTTVIGGTTGTTQLTTVVNTTWTLANSTTTTPKPPIQCLSPGPAPAAGPKPGANVAGQLGASGMHADISQNVTFPPGVETTCYTIIVSGNATTKPEDLTNLIVFDKEPNKTTVPLITTTTSISTTTVTSLPSNISTSTQFSTISTIFEEKDEDYKEEEEKETTTGEVTATSIHTTSITEEELENAEARSSLSPTASEEEIENEAVVINISTSEVKSSSAIPSALTEPASNISIIATETTSETAAIPPVSGSTFAPTEGQLETTFGIIETAVIYNLSTLAEVTLETTESLPIVTAATNMSSPPTETYRVIETTESAAVAVEEVVTTQQELIISSSIPTLPGELETIHEATGVTQGIVATTPIIAKTAQEVSVIAPEVSEIVPAANVSEGITEVIESTMIAEHIGSETTISEMETIAISAAPETEGKLEEITVLSTIQEIAPIITPIVEQSEDEDEYIEEQEEIGTYAASSSISPSEIAEPIKGNDSHLIEGEFTAAKAGQSGRNESPKTFTLSQFTSEEKEEIQESTEQLVSTETGTCTEWNMTELVTEPVEQELTYIMHFTQEYISSTEENDDHYTKQRVKPVEGEKEVFLAGKVISLNGSDVDIQEPKQSSTYATEIEQSTQQATTSKTVITAEETTEVAEEPTTIQETEQPTEETTTTMATTTTIQEAEQTTEETTTTTATTTIIQETEQTTEETTTTAATTTIIQETEQTTEETTTTAATTTMKPTESATTTMKPTESTTTTMKSTESTTTTMKPTESTTTTPTIQTETTTTTSTTQTKPTTHSTTKPTTTTHHSTTKGTTHTTHKTTKHTSTTKHTTAKATNKGEHTKMETTTECITTELPECDEVEE